jgi:hypothetical protein
MILNRHDPVGLIRMGMPEDEYEPEVGASLPRLREAAGPQDVQRVLLEAFEHWFGTRTSLFGYEEFAPAAFEVWQAFERFRDRSEPPV